MKFSTAEQQLKLISRAWGRQSGYCFFPWIGGKATSRVERAHQFHEGPAFLWPDDRKAILAHFDAHTEDDLYWCPSLFEGKRRDEKLAMDEHALWADLDGVDPRQIKDYPPTIAWETSPGSFQALWLTQTDVQGASWPGRENQQLTYHLQADSGGWDTVQLLRVPGRKNFKPNRVAENDGVPPQGQVLWTSGRIYQPDEFGGLPELPGVAALVEVLEEDLAAIDRHEVWGRVRMRVSPLVRELVSAKVVAGDRSDKLWQIERELADAGCTISEIVAIARHTVWNKFAGRADEVKRLTTEAAKAVAARPPEKTKEIEEERESKPMPTNLFTLVKDAKPPKWLVRNIITEGACGFIGGEPKSHKSWFGLDLALSVASGSPFLGTFEVENPGPVLYIQEEDSAPMVKRRLNKVWPSKAKDVMRVDPTTGSVSWAPPDPYNTQPPIDGYIGNTFIISDPGWQSWLDEQVEEKQYKLIIMDPFMMMAGEIDENRSQEMTNRIFRPLKELARKHNVAITIVHHLKKGDPRAAQRGGQRMLGSVANHAWAEDSLYLSRIRGGDLGVEQESKSSPLPGFKVSRLRNNQWTPEVHVTPLEEDDPDHHVRAAGDRYKPGDPDDVDGVGADGVKPYQKSSRQAAVPKVIVVLKAEGRTMTTAEIAQAAGLTTNAASKQLARAYDKKLVLRVENNWTLAP